MNEKLTTIAIDAMGGDNSPYKALKGAEIFSKKNLNIKIIFFGNSSLIKETLLANKIEIKNFDIIHTFNNIKNDDTANIIVRKRKESSIYQGLSFIKDNEKSGFVSAGNTGALMILSRLLLGMINGIDRPAICSIIPNIKNFSIMLDLGANTSVGAKNLFEFALMGYSYHSLLKPEIKAKIGIINIGTEDNKGLEFLKEANDLILSSFLKDFYIGFIEPNKITSDNCNIMISDGYTGNIMLKTAEGMSEFITKNLKNVFIKSLKNKIAFKIVENDLKIFKDQINPEKYNGASFMGVNGVSIKSHGNATPYAFSCALERCLNFVDNNINQQIRNNIVNSL